MHSIGSWIRKERLKLGLTQEGLARRANCATVTVSKWEAGFHEPRPIFMSRLAELFGSTPKAARTKQLSKP